MLEAVGRCEAAGGVRLQEVAEGGGGVVGTPGQLRAGKGSNVGWVCWCVLVCCVCVRYCDACTPARVGCVVSKRGEAPPV